MSKLSWKNTSFMSKSVNRTGSNVDFKELFLRPTPDRAPGSESVNTVRFLERPTAYLVHWGNKRTQGGEFQRVAFPDADQSNRPNRVCFSKVNADGSIKEDPDCPWCQMGYSRQRRFMVNVVSRENERVMVLDTTQEIIASVLEWCETAEEEDINSDPSSWDEPAPDFRIKAKRQQGNSIKWRVTATQKTSPIGEEEKEMVRQMNPEADTDEEALKLFPVETLTKPTPLSGSEPPKSADDDEEYGDDPLNDDKPSAPEKKKPAKKKAAKKPVEPEDDDEDEGNAYEDSDPDVDESKETLKPISLDDDEDEDDDFDDW